jgi:hypothetical protein
VNPGRIFRVAACPRGALRFSLGFDAGFRDLLVRRAPALSREDTESDAKGDRLRDRV